MNKKAFTLIELLVVIVIVGILAGLLIPVMGRVREGARRAICCNNLRQHGIAWHMYWEEHNDTFPKYGECTRWSFGGKAGTTSTGAQDRVLNKYLEIYDETSHNLELFHCPDDIKSTIYNWRSMYNWMGTSYMANEFIIIYNIYSPRPLSTITAPWDILVLETDWSYNNPGHDNKGGVSTGSTALLMVLFVDGHIGGPYIYPDEFGGTPDEEPRPKAIYEPEN